MNKRQKIGHAIIKVSRKAFAGSKVQEWKITSIVYARVFDAMYGQKNVEAIFRGALFTLPTKDITLTPSVLAGSFEQNELDIFERICSKSSTVIDVGANIGLYSAIAGKRVGSKGKVYAFEPIPENLKLLSENIAKNNLEKVVEIHQTAIGEKSGSLDIYLSARQVGTHSAAKRTADAHSVSVPMESVDSFAKKHKVSAVDIMKVDVEGYDGQVLAGALKTLKKFQPTLFIEYSPSLLKDCGQDPEQFIDTLMSIYKHCVLVDEFKGLVEDTSAKHLKSLKIATNVNLVLTNSDSTIQKIHAA